MSMATSIAKDNKPPPFTLAQALEDPQRDTSRIVLPIAAFAQEREKISHRLPTAIEFIKRRRLNETFERELSDIVLQGWSL